MDTYFILLDVAPRNWFAPRTSKVPSRKPFCV
jgi:hypothetical protein